MSFKYALLRRLDGLPITPRSKSPELEIQYSNEPYKGMYFVARYVKPAGPSPGVVMYIDDLDHTSFGYWFRDGDGVEFELILPKRAA